MGDLTHSLLTQIRTTNARPRQVFVPTALLSILELHPVVAAFEKNPCENKSKGDHRTSW